MFFFMALISILSFNAYAQEPVNNNEFASIVNEPLREKIYAHTDKDFYITGEILWFKLYDVSADSLKPLALSNIAYVEILNASQKPVLQSAIALNNGSGNGSFYLTSSLASGNYILRAYTNWMKNFGADAFFQKQITIVNTLKQLPKNTTKDSAFYETGFFPEGGDLVTGIESKIGFKITDKYGKGVNCSGNIIDESNRNIASFSTLKFGMGAFSFTPAEDHSYAAIININGKIIKQLLPSVLRNGYVMHVADEHNRFSVSVSSANTASQAVYLTAFNGNKLVTEQQATIANGKATFSLNKNELPAGITHLIVLDNNKQPVAERIVFIKPQSLSLKLAADKNEYNTRSEVKLNIAGNDNADLSMAVYLVDSLQTVDDNNILNYLWLGSELKGSIESPEYYFNNSGAEVDAALENLLLTQGWTRFKKDAKPFKLRYAPEREGHIIEGTVVNKTSGTPAKDIRVYLSVPGKYFRFASAISNDNGKVFFDIKDYYGSGELVVQTGSEDSIYRVEIENPFSSQPGNSEPAAFDFSEAKLQWLSQYNLAMQVQNAYSINQLNKFNFPAIDSNAFYGKPDVTYYLDNYVRFNTMEEVLREYITGINVRLRQGNYSLISIDQRKHDVFQNNPLVLIDGVPVFDMNKLMAYNPLKIKKAEVLHKKYYYNSLIAEGIVSYSTYKGDLEGFQFDPSTIELSYDGLQLQREFYSPQYVSEEQRQSRLPDYRNVLYWNSEIKNDEPSFYTSDIKGKYIVVVQGINADGKAGYTTTEFEVK